MKRRHCGSLGLYDVVWVCGAITQRIRLATGTTSATSTGCPTLRATTTVPAASTFICCGQGAARQPTKTTEVWQGAGFRTVRDKLGQQFDSVEGGPTLDHAWRGRIRQGCATTTTA